MKYTFSKSAMTGRIMIATGTTLALAFAGGIAVAVVPPEPSGSLVAMPLPAVASDAHHALVAFTAAAGGLTGDGVAGGVTGPPPTDNAPPGRFSDAPTEQLRRVAGALQLRHTSVTTVVSAPAGLNLAIPMEISVLFGVERITQQYDNSAGSRLLFDFAAHDGAKRHENVTITLREITPKGRSYTISWSVELEPLFRITLGPLHFQEYGDCDFASKADPRIKWLSPDNVLHEDKPAVDSFGHAQVNAFAAVFRSVGASSRRLTEPGVTWVDDDLGHEFLPPPVPSTVLLVPGTTRRVTWTDTSEADCDAGFWYDITYQVRTYPGI